MIRHFNYTDRRRILHEHVRIVVNEERDRASSFTADIQPPSDMRLPPNAAVWLEAYSGPTQMRFPFGRVGELRPPSDPRLHRFRPGEKVLFRLKVVDESDGLHRIVAWADKLRPLLPEEAHAGRRSLLPVETAELGERLWALRWIEDQPILQLNEAFREPRDITAIARTDADFVALVYPAVIRQILHTLLLTDEIALPEEGDSNVWVDFAERELGAGPHPDFSEADDQSRLEVAEWIERAVDGFCRRQSAMRRYAESKGGPADAA